MTCMACDYGHPSPLSVIHGCADRLSIGDLDRCRTMFETQPSKGLMQCLNHGVQPLVGLVVLMQHPQLLEQADAGVGVPVADQLGGGLQLGEFELMAWA
jgi:hypothetical protein